MTAPTLAFLVAWFGALLDGFALREAAAERYVEDRLGIMSEIRIVAGGLVMIAIIAMILYEVFNAVNISDGPFDISDELTTTGIAAITLLVVGLLVVAAAAIMRILSRSGFGTR